MGVLYRFGVSLEKELIDTKSCLSPPKTGVAYRMQTGLYLEILRIARRRLCGGRLLCKAQYYNSQKKIVSHCINATTMNEMEFGCLSGFLRSLRSVEMTA